MAHQDLSLTQVRFTVPVHGVGHRARAGAAGSIGNGDPVGGAGGGPRGPRWGADLEGKGFPEGIGRSGSRADRQALGLVEDLDAAGEVLAAADHALAGGKGTSEGGIVDTAADRGLASTGVKLGRQR